MEASLNRRSFLKGAALAGITSLGLGMAGCAPAADNGKLAGTSSPEADATGTVLDDAVFEETPWDFEIAPDPIDESLITETIEADAVIIGSGLSGLTCAYSAIESGVDVVLFSASDHPVARGGTNHSFNTRVQKERCIDYTPETYRKQFKFELHCYDGRINQKLWWRWVNNSEESQNWLIDIMESEGAEITIEKPYVDDDGAYEQQRSALNFLIPEEKMSDTLKEFMLSGNIQDIAAGSNTGALAQAFVMAKKFTEAGGRIDYGRCAQYLEKDNAGRVTSVIAKAGDAYVRYVGRKAIVLATGDFSQNHSMMRRFCPDAMEYLFDQEVDYNAMDRFGGLMSGDGHKMGLWAGAAWQRTPNSFLIIDIMGAPTVQHMGFHPGLVMNKEGERFMNEDTNAVMCVPQCKSQTDSTYYCIWDTAWANHYDSWEQFGVTCDGDNGPKPKTPAEELARWDEGVYVKGDTIEDVLAQLEGIDVEAAKKTIERYNGFCENGVDEDFHKNPKHLATIKTGPFYGFSRVIDGARFLNVMGGLRTNEMSQVCDENDNPIEGLYNIGCMTGDVYTGVYSFMFSGQSLGMTCDTLPYLLGRELAKL